MSNEDRKPVKRCALCDIPEVHHYQRHKFVEKKSE